ncbi:MAG: hypothetical protein ACRC9R_01605, partial [Enterovibrio sp.]
MSSSDQATNANALRQFTVPQLQELLEGRLDGESAGNLHNLVIRLSNTQAQPQTQSLARPSGPSQSSPQDTAYTVVQDALRNQSRATSSSEPTQNTPTTRQLLAISELLRHHAILHRAQQQRDQAVTELQALEDDALDSTLMASRSALQANLEERRVAVTAAINELRRLENEFRLAHPELRLPLATDDPLLQAGAAVQPHVSGDALASDGGAGAAEASAAEPADAQGASGSSHGATPTQETLYERVASSLSISQEATSAQLAPLIAVRASAAASALPSHPIPESVRAILRRIDEGLDRQYAMQGSLHAANNLMLHLHNVMNRQLLTAMPVTLQDFSAFCLNCNEESGLSNLSLVQMLTALLRSSPNEETRLQIAEILVRDINEDIPAVRLLDRTYPGALSPVSAWMALSRGGPVCRAKFAQLVLDLCRLALSEM